MLATTEAFRPRRAGLEGRTMAAYGAVVGLACFLGLLGPCPAAAQTVIVHDGFEDGTLQGWIPRGGAVLTNTTAAAYEGTHSLQTTGRTANWNGPSIDVTDKLTKSTPYQVTAWVRLVVGQAADTLKITVQRTVGGANSYDAVVSSPAASVTDGAWVKLQGYYTFTTDATALLLYVEAGGATTQFYVDAFDITQIPAAGCSVPPDNSGIHTNFETATKEGWSQRGAGSLTAVSDDTHTGTSSVLSSGRTASWNGPSINAGGKLCNGSRYTVVAWVKMAPGQPDSQLRVSVQRTFGGVTNYNTIVTNTTVTASQWVRLKTTFDFIWNYDSLSMYVESSTGTASFYLDDFDLKYVPPPVIQAGLPSVAETLAGYFPVGAAIWAGDLGGPHSELLLKHFASVTSENDMKWDATERTEGSFTFANADAQVAFAKAHGMRVRGHALVWHKQTPAWVFQDASGADMSQQPFSEANRTLLLERMKNHIRALIQHFGADVSAWDVVNEPFDESQSDGFGRTPWYLIAGGPDYIDLAFQYAREAIDELGLPPDSIKLYLNEYSTTVPAKRDFMAAYLAGAKERGVPIDGVGHQMHCNVNWPLNDDPASANDVAQAIEKFSALGLDNQITEMDVSIYRVNAPNQTIYSDYDDIVAFDQGTLIEQGYRYRDYFQVFRRLADKISSVTLWGQADDHTWRTTGSTVNAPLLFDNGLQAKYAYWGVVDPLELPGADLATSISVDPSPVLSGHTLTYVVTVTNNGHDAAANLSLIDALPAGTVFQSLAAPTDWSCATPAIGETGQVSCTTAAMDSGASAHFALAVLVACAMADGTTLSNSATVASNTRDPNPEANNTASIAVLVSNPPPSILDLGAHPAVLWPANHSLRLVTLRYGVDDNCDAGIVPSITISSSQQEPEQRHHRPEIDWKVLDSHHVLLRAEIAPFSWAGRTYTVTLTATDSAGSQTANSVQVRVPLWPGWWLMP